jgi:hypothetical protein
MGQLIGADCLPVGHTCSDLLAAWENEDSSLNAQGSNQSCVERVYFIDGHIICFGHLPKRVVSYALLDLLCQPDRQDGV